MPPARTKTATAKPAKRATTSTARTASRPMPARRADYGAPIDAFFAKQPPQLRPILVELRKMIEAAAPDATASLKWGMPFFTLNGRTLCALAGFKSHANLILPGAPGTLADPDGLLEGEGKTGQHIKLRSIDELPRAAVKRWLAAVVKSAKKGGDDPLMRR